MSKSPQHVVFSIDRRLPARACAALGSRSWWLALTMGLVLALNRAPCRADGTKPFSADEQKRLQAGKLIVRPVSERSGDLKLIGGSSWILIKAPPDVVYRALLDTKRYDKLLPTVTGAQLVSQEKDFRRVRFEHKKGLMRVAYRLGLTLVREQRLIKFKLNDRLDSGMRATWGHFGVTPYGPDKSLLSYSVMADPGHGLIVALVRGVIHEWILKAPAQIRRFIESKQGKALYASGLLERGAAADGCRDGHVDGSQAQKCAP
jgi:carbon monoxide dehydrogenase subunit G